MATEAGCHVFSVIVKFQENLCFEMAPQTLVFWPAEPSNFIIAFSKANGLRKGITPMDNSSEILRYGATEPANTRVVISTIECNTGPSTNVLGNLHTG